MFEENLDDARSLDKRGQDTLREITVFPARHAKTPSKFNQLFERTNIRSGKSSLELNDGHRIPRYEEPRNKSILFFRVKNLDHLFVLRTVLSYLYILLVWSLLNFNVPFTRAAHFYRSIPVLYSKQN